MTKDQGQVRYYHVDGPKAGGFLYGKVMWTANPNDAPLIRSSWESMLPESVDSHPRSQLLGLPNELEQRIAGYVGGEGLRALRSTNKRGRQIAGDCVSFLRVTEASQLARAAEIFPRLRTLDLAGVSELDDGSASAVNRLKDLRRIDLRGCYRLSKNAIDFNTLPRIENVNLGYSSLATNTVVRSLLRVATIKTLDLRLSAVDDRALQEAPASNALTELHLNGCEKISDTGLDTLSRFANLRLLDLSECTQLQPDRIRDIFSARSDIEVLARGCVGEEIAANSHENDADFL